MEAGFTTGQFCDWLLNVLHRAAKKVSHYKGQTARKIGREINRAGLRQFNVQALVRTCRSRNKICLSVSRGAVRPAQVARSKVLLCRISQLTLSTSDTSAIHALHSSSPPAAPPNQPPEPQPDAGSHRSVAHAYRIYEILDYQRLASEVMHASILCQSVASPRVTGEWTRACRGMPCVDEG